jgi:WD40 repeat protein
MTRCVMFCLFHFSDSTLISISADSHIKLTTLATAKLFRSTKLSDLTLSCLALCSDQKSVVVGGWDNMVQMYEIGYGRGQ